MSSGAIQPVVEGKASGLARAVAALESDKAFSSGKPPLVPGSRRATTLVLGLGNDILTDDAVGLLVARQLATRFADHPCLDVRETSEMGLALLDFIEGYSKVFLVDSIETGRAPAGTLHEIDAAEFSALPGRSPHFLGVGDTLAFGRLLGLAMPQEVKVFAIEVQDAYTLGEKLSAMVDAALPSVVQRIAAALMNSISLGCFEISSALTQSGPDERDEFLQGDFEPSLSRRR